MTYGDLIDAFEALDPRDRAACLPDFIELTEELDPPTEQTTVSGLYIGGNMSDEALQFLVTAT